MMSSMLFIYLFIYKNQQILVSVNIQLPLNLFDQRDLLTIRGRPTVKFHSSPTFIECPRASVRVLGVAISSGYKVVRILGIGSIFPLTLVKLSNFDCTKRF